jgi:hypothetical protein
MRTAQGSLFLPAAVQIFANHRQIDAKLRIATASIRNEIPAVDGEAIAEHARSENRCLHNCSPTLARRIRSRFDLAAFHVPGQNRRQFLRRSSFVISLFKSNGAIGLARGDQLRRLRPSAHL